MLTYSLILFFKAATVMLVVALFVQVTRCYRIDQRNALHLWEKQNSPMQAKRNEDVPQLDIAARIDMSAQRAAPEPVSVSKPEAILNDYIGGFFHASSNEAVTDISPFKASKPAMLAQIEPENQANSLPLPEVEEEFIVVDAEQRFAGVDNKIMSDKVVHAMLDEARLIRAS